MTAMIEISNAEKTFTMHLQGGVQLPVVRGVSFDVEPGSGSRAFFPAPGASSRPERPMLSCATGNMRTSAQKTCDPVHRSI